jgi:hypothetical protein
MGMMPDQATLSDELNVAHTWGKQDVVLCELIMAGTKNEETYSLDMDSHNVRRWYVRLSKPVEEIDGIDVYDEDGRLSSDFKDMVYDGLWDYGLASPTGLSAYSPTGRVCVSLNMHVKGRRIIVENTRFMDI